MTSKRKATKHRLVPLETLYPTRETPREAPKAPTPFYKPGKSSEISDRPSEIAAVRYLHASTIKNNLISLEQPLVDIEDDSAFIANAMNSALQVPKAIDVTFNRIHGRIYDIQREIEYSSNALDDKALIIQSNFRSYSNQQHLSTIIDALHNTVRRDCASIHECLLGFLLSYSKGDDHFRMLLNRRFLVRNRNALKFWRQWCVEVHQAEREKKREIGNLQKKWIERVSAKLIRNWKWLSFSKHSRKALKELHGRIASEAQKRLAERTARADPSQFNLSILDLLALERENVIIDFGRQNYINHTQSIVFRFWRLYMDQCKNASRSGNAIAREHYTHRMKQSFFNAWFSLSVGRVVLWGGYSPWHRPENKLKIKYEADFVIKSDVIKAWRWLCIRRARMIEFSKKREKNFARVCLLEYKIAASKRRERLSKMIENYVDILHQRMHKVFEVWHIFTAKERVRKQPSLFILKRSELMRKYRVIRQCFRRWNVRFIVRQTLRFQEETKSVDSYIKHWASAGDEMRESINLIGQLNEKLSSELTRRKTDLAKSVASADFMKNEQVSLALAIKNVKYEIEKLHGIIGKSSMRYFVDVKPVHGHVVADVPKALEQYIEQKEAEKQRLIAQKAAAAASITPVQRQTRNTQNTNASKRRKTTFVPSTHQSTKQSRQQSRASRSRKSTGSGEPVADDEEEEE